MSRMVISFLSFTTMSGLFAFISLSVFIYDYGYDYDYLTFFLTSYLLQIILYIKRVELLLKSFFFFSSQITLGLAGKIHYNRRIGPSTLSSTNVFCKELNTSTSPWFLLK